jgi:diadenosine tetraphosphatase ApaH/serine/threonine PP2A family protein phosphatase
MRYLVLTDIHANLEALDACLADARSRGFDGTLVLGDVVGYGPDPNPVIERVKALEPAGIVRGNHDKVACGLEPPEGFNLVARSAALWSFDALTPDHRTWLATMPRGPVKVDELVEICHGSPVDEDAYIFDELDAVRALRASERPLCLFGHTHTPFTFEQSQSSADTVDVIGPSRSHEGQVVLRQGYKYLLNPGAVGQPRDGDPRAAYAVVDTDRRLVELFRLAYPVEITQAKVIKAGLPEVLAQRLAVGR